MSPRVLVFGGGSIGAVLAYLLSKSISASNIVVVCRSNFDIVAKDGFTINSTVYGMNESVKPIAVRSVAEAVQAYPDGFDYICVATKAIVRGNVSQPELIKPAVSAKTTIVLMQNGISIEEPYKALFPDTAIASVVIYMPCTQTAPGVVSHTVYTKFLLGTYPAKSAIEHKNSTARFVELLNDAGASATHEDDIQLARWTKLLVNGSQNPICALSRLRDVQFLGAAPGAESFCRKVMREIASIARAEGYSDVDDSVVERQLQLSARRAPPGVEPSMLADALAGQNLEVECIVGNALRIAQSHGVDVPRLETIYYLAKGLDMSFAIPKALLGDSKI
jgi:2-dehydropantoate 2-reductase